MLINTLYDSSDQDYNNDENSFNMFFSKDINDFNFLNEDKNEDISPIEIQYRFKEDIPTAYKTNPNPTTKEPEKNVLPDFNSIDNIINYLSKFINDEEMNKKLLAGISSIKNIENYETIELTKKKRKREKEKEKITKKLEINIQNGKINKRGRKKEKNSQLNKIHDNMSPDNIIKKIKSKIFKCILNFLNKVLNLDNENKLLKLDYAYVNTLKREDEINLLDKTLREIFSLNISSKFKTKPADYNEIIIDKILNRELCQNDYQTNEFVLNIKYGEFIQLFIHKKNLEDLILFNSNISNINYSKIKDNFPFVESLLNELLNQNGPEYTCLFLTYLFNLKRSLTLKQVRVYKEKNEEK